MAAIRRLSTTLTTRHASLRHCSTHATSIEAAAKEEAERLAMKKLEEAVQRIVAKRAEPGWMRLVPGGSYWVPPKSKERGVVDVVAKLVKDSASASASSARRSREVVFLKDNDQASLRGWPTSAHFFKGTSHSPLEGEITPKHTKKTEEEEG